MKKVLVTFPVNDRHKQYLEEIGKDYEFEYASVKTATEAQIQAASIILGNVPPALIHGSENLEWFQLHSAGADQYCKPGVLAPKTILTNATGAYGLAISEHMLGMTLMLQKKLDRYYANQLNCQWKDEGLVTSIWNSVTLVIGLGDIGGEYARKMKALGSYVIGIRRTPGRMPEYLDELYTIDQLDDLLPKADIVALSLPNTPATCHLMNRERLARMKEHSLLINVGRGTAIDTAALIDSLKSGHLGGCAVDVTDPEPLPSDHPLWNAPNMLITPHVSGMYHLPETLERVVKIAGENFRQFLAGQELKNLVDFETGYRKR